VVPGFNPLIIDVNEPVPVPILLTLSWMEGSVETDQQTPLEVISEFPSFVITPPEDAVVGVISVTSLVVRIGRVGFFLQELIPDSRQITTINANVFLAEIIISELFYSIKYDYLSSIHQIKLE
jgi:hypothetical protein